MESPLLTYLGRISYGLYIIHNYANSLIANAIVWLGVPTGVARFCQAPLVRLFLLLSVTIGLASLSWHLFESPINNLKHKFPYFIKGKSASAVYERV